MTVEDMALTFVPKLGVRGAVHLLRCFGSAAAIYSASEDELRSRAELRADIARDIANGRGMRDAEREAEYCRRCGITPVASTDDAYPPLLREIDDYPAVIYVNGDVEALTGPIQGGSEKKEESRTADIVIVGSGIAGLSAALSAAETGADVVVLEKMATTGGTTALSGAT